MGEDPHRLKQIEDNLQRMNKVMKGIRKRSSIMMMGLPLYDIALGPDIDKGEIRGHAKGILAIGDIATGGVAIGGFARGIIAAGGFAMGGIAFGGAALGGIAIGGAALGVIAIGGAAAGYYATGGAAYGAV